MSKKILSNVNIQWFDMNDEKKNEVNNEKDIKENDKIEKVNEIQLDPPKTEEIEEKQKDNINEEQNNDEYIKKILDQYLKKNNIKDDEPKQKIIKKRMFDFSTKPLFDYSSSIKPQYILIAGTILYLLYKK